MKLGTKPFFVIIGLSCLWHLTGASPGTSQIKLCLDFDDSNFVVRKDALSGMESANYLPASFFEKSRLTLSDRGEPSPAGGRYWSLDGITDFVKLPANSATNIRGEVAYSVSCWINLPSERTQGEIINASDNFLSGYRFFVDDNIPKLEILEGASEIFSSGTRLQANRWYHVGFFYDGIGDTLVMFVNGYPVAAVEFSKVTQVNTGPNAYIGASITSANANYLRARLDDLRFFVGRDSIFDDAMLRAEDEVESGRKRRTNPPAFSLTQNYPNPFNLTTTIGFELRKSGYAEIQVYDLLGNMLRTIYQGELSAGIHEYAWEAQDKNGRALPSGIYFVRMTFDGDIQTKKMILVK